MKEDEAFIIKIGQCPINLLDQQFHSFIVNMLLTTSSFFGLSASSFWTGISFETKLYVVTTTS